MNNRQTEDFERLTKVDEALRTLLDSLGAQPVKLQYVPRRLALGRVLGKEVVANTNLPPFDRAVMDGYAVRAQDVGNASQQTPSVLRLVGESKLGETCRVHVQPGEAVTVATGSMVPVGADTVVIVERTSKLPGSLVAVHAPAELGQSIARKGEDLVPGRPVLKKGIRLRPQDIGVLEELGLLRIPVVRRPRIGVLSTGNELVDTGHKSRVKSVDINRPIISLMIQEAGASPVDLGIVRDQEAQIIAALKRGVKACDAVIVTAGSSVGKGDLVPTCINRLGKPGMLVHGVAMRPAMPTGLAVVNGKPVLSFPGFPVSAMFAFRVFARPIIARMMGIREPVYPTVRAVLSERISGAPGYRTFVRVTVEKRRKGLTAKPLKLQRSSVLMSMVAANGIVTIPEDHSAYEAGQAVEVELIGELEP